MNLTAARLVDGDTEITLLPSDGPLVMQSLDVIAGEVREAVEARPNSDGATDRSMHIGEGAVVLTAAAVGNDTLSAAQTVTLLRRLLHPSRRPVLYYTPQGEGERTVTLRADNVDSPLATRDNRTHVALQASWRVPAGVSFGSQIVETANPAEGESGITFPLTFAFAFPASTGLGTVLVDNPGSAPSSPLVRVYGPCTGPRLANNTTGQTLEFSADLSIDAGAFLEVDFDRRTVRMNGNSDAGANRRGLLDFAVSSWWTLQPGTNEVRFYPVTHSTPSVAEFVYSPAYL